MAPVQIRVSPLNPFLWERKALLEKKTYYKGVLEKMFYVYVLRCKDGSLYTGYTNDLKKRLKLHNLGNASKYTRSRRPVKLVVKWPFKSKSQAMKYENAFKKLTRKEKIKKINLRSSRF